MYFGLHQSIADNWWTANWSQINRKWCQENFFLEGFVCVRADYCCWNWCLSTFTMSGWSSDVYSPPLCQAGWVRMSHKTLAWLFSTILILVPLIHIRYRCCSTLFLLPVYAAPCMPCLPASYTLLWYTAACLRLLGTAWNWGPVRFGRPQPLFISCLSPILVLRWLLLLCCFQSSLFQPPICFLNVSHLYTFSVIYVMQGLVFPWQSIWLLLPTAFLLPESFTKQAVVPGGHHLLGGLMFYPG